MNQIQEIIAESIAVKQLLMADQKSLAAIKQSTDAIEACYRKGGKVLFCGNGGSAADAQHFAAELTGRFKLERPPLYAEALHVNSSFMTAVANDYSYDQVFSRLTRAMGRQGDVLMGISTSGNSSNVVAALKVCRELGLFSIGLTGQSGGAMRTLCDVLITIPSTDTPRIQEAHVMVGHIICQAVEERLFVDSQFKNN